MRKLHTWGALLIVMLFSTFSPAQKTSKVAYLFLDELFNPNVYNQLEWRNIGPFRGGRSVAVTGVPGEPLIYYMGSTGGGVWKTTDAGQSWSNISDGYFYAGSIGAISVAPSDPNIVYVGTGEHAVRSVMTSAGNGLYRSYDAGQSWTYIGLPKSQHIASITVHPENADIVYVAVQGALYGPSENRGVYKSTDGGQNWRKVLYVNETTGAADLSMDWNNPRILYAAMWDHQRYPWKIRSGGSGSAIYKSVDGGENWTKLNGGLPQKMGKAGIDVSRADANIVFANIEAQNGGVFRSNDGGKTWMQTSTDRRTIARAWYYTEIVTDPVDPETVYILNTSLLRSIDGGYSFQPIESPHEDQHDLWINPNRPQNMILANDGGACISFNGGSTWSTQQNQPTGQFYRVIADHQFPYRIYGAQQDNSTVSIASRTAGLGIDVQDWHAVSGCESGFIAFNPDRPDPIYGGCYQGMISTYDPVTQTEKNIMVYPELGLAEEPKNLRFRFNWNAPIVASPHNSDIIYHAGNVVLRTRNEGLSWEVISPDLTRNDTTKQALGGGPYTNEGAGAEVYNTISYLQCSPHDPGTIWVGSDDGLVHLTRDEGKSWQNVTPPGLEEALINSIEISPHRMGGAYIVATRYRFNDQTPLIYHTDDFGKHWELITDGIASNHFVRVVREDPQRPGLLYAGTEYGFYLSYNNGKRWHRFSLNLPVCPITDLTIHDNDLIAATSGRGFWILDDLSPLQNGLGELHKQHAVLFPPKPAIRFDSRATGRSVPGIGRNPLPGLLIDYYLPEKLDSERVELNILDEKGTVLRRYTNQSDPNLTSSEGGPDLSVPLPTQQGVNRFNWDLRRSSAPGIPDVFVLGNYHGGMVVPGKYTIRLLLPADTLEQTVEVLPDPRLKVPLQTYIQQQEFLERIEQSVTDIHDAVNRLRSVQTQIQQLNHSIGQMESAAAVVAKGNEVCRLITEWESKLIQTKQKTAQDVINYPSRLSAAFLSLHNMVDNPDPRITEGARLRLQDLMQEWRKSEQQMQEILQMEVAHYNKLFREKQIPAVVVPDLAEDKP